MYNTSSRFEIVEDKLKRLGIKYSASRMTDSDHNYMLINFSIERLSKELMRFLNEFEYLEYNIGINEKTTTNENDEVITNYLFIISIFVY